MNEIQSRIKRIFDEQLINQQAIRNTSYRERALYQVFESKPKKYMKNFRNDDWFGSRIKEEQQHQDVHRGNSYDDSPLKNIDGEYYNVYWRGTDLAGNPTQLEYVSTVVQFDTTLPIVDLIYGSTVGSEWQNQYILLKKY